MFQNSLPHFLQASVLLLCCSSQPHLSGEPSAITVCPSPRLLPAASSTHRGARRSPWWLPARHQRLFFSSPVFAPVDHLAILERPLFPGLPVFPPPPPGIQCQEALHSSLGPLRMLFLIPRHFIHPLASEAQPPLLHFQWPSQTGCLHTSTSMHPKHSCNPGSPPGSPH